MFSIYLLILKKTTMKKIKFSLLSAFFCAGMLLVTACHKDDDNNTEQSDKTVSVLGVTLDKTSVSLEVGATLTLTATVSPDNADNKTVTWSSSDEAVATVDENGKVTAVAVGNVTITAKAGDKTAECKVTISAKIIAVESITFDESSLSLLVGDSKTLTATVSPENADNKTVTWSSSDEAIATVDENGKVTAVAAGTATIKASANDGSGMKAECEVTVIFGWNYSVISAYTPGTPRGGITIEGASSKIDRNFYSGTWTFKIDEGRKFKKIEMASSSTNFSGTGVTIENYPFYSAQDRRNYDNGKKIIWEGDASSVTFSGHAYAVEYIKFVIE